MSPRPHATERNAITSALHHARSLAIPESRVAIAPSRVALDERLVACREESSSLACRVQQSAHDRKENGMRDCDKVWNFLRPSPPEPDSSTPPVQESDSTSTPA